MRSANRGGRWTRAFAAFGVLVAALAIKGGEELLNRYHVGLNKTESLDDWGYIVDRRNRSPKRGDLVEFVVPNNRYYPAGASFVKRVVGLPGDLVERRGEHVYVAGRDVGRVKTHDRQGRPVEAGPTGVIPPGHLYVAGDHQDSLDSRYAVIGFIEARRVIGVGEAII
jgi:conjugal transfer pilin signal peptidase TrbI